MYKRKKINICKSDLLNFFICVILFYSFKFFDNQTRVQAVWFQGKMVIKEKRVESNKWKRNIADINKKTLGLLEDNIDIMSNVIHSQSFT